MFVCSQLKQRFLVGVVYHKLILFRVYTQFHETLLKTITVECEGGGITGGKGES